MRMRNKLFDSGPTVSILLDKIVDCVPGSVWWLCNSIGLDSTKQCYWLRLPAAAVSQEGSSNFTCRTLGQIQVLRYAQSVRINGIHLSPTFPSEVVYIETTFSNTVGHWRILWTDCNHPVRLETTNSNYLYVRERPVQLGPDVHIHGWVSGRLFGKDGDNLPLCDGRSLTFNWCFAVPLEFQRVTRASVSWSGTLKHTTHSHHISPIERRVRLDVSSDASERQSECSDTFTPVHTTTEYQTTRGDYTTRSTSAGRHPSLLDPLFDPTSQLVMLIEEYDHAHRFTQASHAPGNRSHSADHVPAERLSNPSTVGPRLNTSGHYPNCYTHIQTRDGQPAYTNGAAISPGKRIIDRPSSLLQPHPRSLYTENVDTVLLAGNMKRGAFTDSPSSPVETVLDASSSNQLLQTCKHFTLGELDVICNPATVPPPWMTRLNEISPMPQRTALDKSWSTIHTPDGFVRGDSDDDRLVRQELSDSSADSGSQSVSSISLIHRRRGSMLTDLIGATNVLAEEILVNGVQGKASAREIAERRQQILHGLRILSEEEDEDDADLNDNNLAVNATGTDSAMRQKHNKDQNLAAIGHPLPLTSRIRSPVRLLVCYFEILCMLSDAFFEQSKFQQFMRKRWSDFVEISSRLLHAFRPSSGPTSLPQCVRQLRVLHSIQSITDTSFITQVSLLECVDPEQRQYNREVRRQLSQLNLAIQRYRSDMNTMVMQELVDGGQYEQERIEGHQGEYNEDCEVALEVHFKNLMNSLASALEDISRIDQRKPTTEDLTTGKRLLRLLPNCELEVNLLEKYLKEPWHPVTDWKPVDLEVTDLRKLLGWTEVEISGWREDARFLQDHYGSLSMCADALRTVEHYSQFCDSHQLADRLEHLYRISMKRAIQLNLFQHLVRLPNGLNDLAIRFYALVDELRSDIDPRTTGLELSIRQFQHQLSVELSCLFKWFGDPNDPSSVPIWVNLWASRFRTAHGQLAKQWISHQMQWRCQALSVAYDFWTQYAEECLSMMATCPGDPTNPENVLTDPDVFPLMWALCHDTILLSEATWNLQHVFSEHQLQIPENYSLLSNKLSSYLKSLLGSVLRHPVAVPTLLKHLKHSMQDNRTQAIHMQLTPPLIGGPDGLRKLLSELNYHHLVWSRQNRLTQRAIHVATRYRDTNPHFVDQWLTSINMNRAWQARIVQALEHIIRTVELIDRERFPIQSIDMIEENLNHDKLLRQEQLFLEAVRLGLDMLPTETSIIRDGLAACMTPTQPTHNSVLATLTELRHLLDQMFHDPNLGQSYSLDLPVDKFTAYCEARQADLNVVHGIVELSTRSLWELCLLEADDCDRLLVPMPSLMNTLSQNSLLRRRRLSGCENLVNTWEQINVETSKRKFTTYSAGFSWTKIPFDSNQLLSIEPSNEGVPLETIIDQNFYYQLRNHVTNLQSPEFRSYKTSTVSADLAKFVALLDSNELPSVEALYSLLSVLNSKSGDTDVTQDFVMQLLCVMLQQSHAISKQLLKHTVVWVLQNLQTMSPSELQVQEPSNVRTRLLSDLEVLRVILLVWRASICHTDAPKWMEDIQLQVERLRTVLAVMHTREPELRHRHMADELNKKLEHVFSKPSSNLTDVELQISCKAMCFVPKSHQQVSSVEYVVIANKWVNLNQRILELARSVGSDSPAQALDIVEVELRMAKLQALEHLLDQFYLNMDSNFSPVLSPQTKRTLNLLWATFRNQYNTHLRSMFTPLAPHQRIVNSFCEAGHTINRITGRIRALLNTRVWSSNENQTSELGGDLQLFLPNETECDELLQQLSSLDHYVSELRTCQELIPSNSFPATVQTSTLDTDLNSRNAIELMSTILLDHRDVDDHIKALLSQTTLLHRLHVSISEHLIDLRDTYTQLCHALPTLSGDHLDELTRAVDELELWTRKGSDENNEPMRSNSMLNEYIKYAGQRLMELETCLEHAGETARVLLLVGRGAQFWCEDRSIDERSAVLQLHYEHSPVCAQLCTAWAQLAQLGDRLGRIQAGLPARRTPPMTTASDEEQPSFEQPQSSEEMRQNESGFVNQSPDSVQNNVASPMETDAETVRQKRLILRDLLGSHSCVYPECKQAREQWLPDDMLSTMISKEQITINEKIRFIFTEVVHFYTQLRKDLIEKSQKLTNASSYDDMRPPHATSTIRSEWHRDRRLVQQYELLMRQVQEVSCHELPQLRKLIQKAGSLTRLWSGIDDLSTLTVEISDFESPRSNLHEGLNDTGFEEGPCETSMFSEMDSTQHTRSTSPGELSQSVKINENLIHPPTILGVSPPGDEVNRQPPDHAREKDNSCPTDMSMDHIVADARLSHIQKSQCSRKKRNKKKTPAATTSKKQATCDDMNLQPKQAKHEIGYAGDKTEDAVSSPEENHAHLIPDTKQRLSSVPSPHVPKHTVSGQIHSKSPPESVTDGINPANPDLKIDAMEERGVEPIVSLNSADYPSPVLDESKLGSGGTRYFTSNDERPEREDSLTEEMPVQSVYQKNSNGRGPIMLPEDESLMYSESSERQTLTDVANGASISTHPSPQSRETHHSDAERLTSPVFEASDIRSSSDKSGPFDSRSTPEDYLSTDVKAHHEFAPQNTSLTKRTFSTPRKFDSRLNDHENQLLGSNPIQDLYESDHVKPDFRNMDDSSISQVLSFDDQFHPRTAKAPKDSHQKSSPHLLEKSEKLKPQSEVTEADEISTAAQALMNSHELTSTLRSVVTVGAQKSEYVSDFSDMITRQLPISDGEQLCCDPDGMLSSEAPREATTHNGTKLSITLLDEVDRQPTSCIADHGRSLAETPTLVTQGTLEPISASVETVKDKGAAMVGFESCIDQTVPSRSSHGQVPKVETKKASINSQVSPMPVVSQDQNKVVSVEIYNVQHSDLSPSSPEGQIASSATDYEEGRNLQNQTDEQFVEDSDTWITVKPKVLINTSRKNRKAKRKGKVSGRTAFDAMKTKDHPKYPTERPGPSTDAIMTTESTMENENIGDALIPSNSSMQYDGSTTNESPLNSKAEVTLVFNTNNTCIVCPESYIPERDSTGKFTGNTAEGIEPSVLDGDAVPRPNHPHKENLANMHLKENVNATDDIPQLHGAIPDAQNLTGTGASFEDAREPTPQESSAQEMLLAGGGTSHFPETSVTPQTVESKLLDVGNPAEIDLLSDGGFGGAGNVGNLSKVDPALRANEVNPSPNGNHRPTGIKMQADEVEMFLFPSTPIAKPLLDSTCSELKMEESDEGGLHEEKMEPTAHGKQNSSDFESPQVISTNRSDDEHALGKKLTDSPKLEQNKKARQQKKKGRRFKKSQQINETAKATDLKTTTSDRSDKNVPVSAQSYKSSSFVPPCEDAGGDLSSVDIDENPVPAELGVGQEPPEQVHLESSSSELNMDTKQSTFDRGQGVSDVPINGKSDTFKEGYSAEGESQHEQTLVDLSSSYPAEATPKHDVNVDSMLDSRSLGTGAGAQKELTADYENMDNSVPDPERLHTSDLFVDHDITPASTDDKSLVHPPISEETNQEIKEVVTLDDKQILNSDGALLLRPGQVFATTKTLKDQNVPASQQEPLSTPLDENICVEQPQIGSIDRGASVSSSEVILNGQPTADGRDVRLPNTIVHTAPDNGLIPTQTEPDKLLQEPDPVSRIDSDSSFSTSQPDERTHFGDTPRKKRQSLDKVDPLPSDLLLTRTDDHSFIDSSALEGQTLVTADSSVDSHRTLTSSGNAKNLNRDIPTSPAAEKELNGDPVFGRSDLLVSDLDGEEIDKPSPSELSHSSAPQTEFNTGVHKSELPPTIDSPHPTKAVGIRSDAFDDVQADTNAASSRVTHPYIPTAEGLHPSQAPNVSFHKRMLSITGKSSTSTDEPCGSQVDETFPPSPIELAIVGAPHDKIRDVREAAENNFEQPTHEDARMQGDTNLSARYDTDEQQTSDDVGVSNPNADDELSQRLPTSAVGASTPPKKTSHVARSESPPAPTTHVSLELSDLSMPSKVRDSRSGASSGLQLENNSVASMKEILLAEQMKEEELSTLPNVDMSRLPGMSILQTESSEKESHLPTDESSSPSVKGLANTDVFDRPTYVPTPITDVFVKKGTKDDALTRGKETKLQPLNDFGSASHNEKSQQSLPNPLINMPTSQSDYPSSKVPAATPVIQSPTVDQQNDDGGAKQNDEQQKRYTDSSALHPYSHEPHRDVASNASNRKSSPNTENSHGRHQHSSERQNETNQIASRTSNGTGVPTSAKKTSGRKKKKGKTQGTKRDGSFKSIGVIGIEPSESKPEQKRSELESVTTEPVVSLVDVPEGQVRNNDFNKGDNQISASNPELSIAVSESSQNMDTNNGLGANASSPEVSDTFCDHPDHAHSKPLSKGTTMKDLCPHSGTETTSPMDMSSLEQTTSTASDLSKLNSRPDKPPARTLESDDTIDASEQLSPETHDSLALPLTDRVRGKHPSEQVATNSTTGTAGAMPDSCDDFSHLKTLDSSQPISSLPDAQRPKSDTSRPRPGLPPIADGYSSTLNQVQQDSSQFPSHKNGAVLEEAESASEDRPSPVDVDSPHAPTPVDTNYSHLSTSPKVGDAPLNSCFAPPPEPMLEHDALHESSDSTILSQNTHETFGGASQHDTSFETEADLSTPVLTSQANPDLVQSPTGKSRPKRKRRSPKENKHAIASRVMQDTSPLEQDRLSPGNQDVISDVRDLTPDITFLSSTYPFVPLSFYDLHATATHAFGNCIFDRDLDLFNAYVPRHTTDYCSEFKRATIPSRDSAEIWSLNETHKLPKSAVEIQVQDRQFPFTNDEPYFDQPRTDFPSKSMIEPRQNGLSPAHLVADPSTRWTHSSSGLLPEPMLKQMSAISFQSVYPTYATWCATDTSPLPSQLIPVHANDRPFNSDLSLHQNMSIRTPVLSQVIPVLDGEEKHRSILVDSCPYPDIDVSPADLCSLPKWPQIYNHRSLESVEGENVQPKAQSEYNDTTSPWADATSRDSSIEFNLRENPIGLMDISCPPAVNPRTSDKSNPLIQQGTQDQLNSASGMPQSEQIYQSSENQRDSVTCHFSEGPSDQKPNHTVDHPNFQVSNGLTSSASSGMPRELTDQPVQSGTQRIVYDGTEVPGPQDYHVLRYLFTSSPHRTSTSTPLRTANEESSFLPDNTILPSGGLPQLIPTDALDENGTTQQSHRAVRRLKRAKPSDSMNNTVHTKVEDQETLVYEPREHSTDLMENSTYTQSTAGGLKTRHEFNTRRTPDYTNDTESQHLPTWHPQSLQTSTNVDSLGTNNLHYGKVPQTAVSNDSSVRHHPHQSRNARRRHVNKRSQSGRQVHPIGSEQNLSTGQSRKRDSDFLHQVEVSCDDSMHDTLPFFAGSSLGDQLNRNDNFDMAMLGFTSGAVTSSPLTHRRNQRLEPDTHFELESSPQSIYDPNFIFSKPEHLVRSQSDATQWPSFSPTLSHSFVPQHGSDQLIYSSVKTSPSLGTYTRHAPQNQISQSPFDSLVNGADDHKQQTDAPLPVPKSQALVLREVSAQTDDRLFDWFKHRSDSELLYTRDDIANRQTLYFSNSFDSEHVDYSKAETTMQWMRGGRVSRSVQTDAYYRQVRINEELVKALSRSEHVLEASRTVSPAIVQPSNRVKKNEESPKQTSKIASFFRRSGSLFPILSLLLMFLLTCLILLCLFLRPFCGSFFSWFQCIEQTFFWRHILHPVRTIRLRNAPF